MTNHPTPRAPRPELGARRVHAASVLADFKRERLQNDHLVDWLSEAVKLATALDTLLDGLQEEEEETHTPGADVAQDDAGWTSGSGGMLP